MNDIAPMSGLGPPPVGLVRIEATRQNTLAMVAGTPVLVRSPDTEGGPNIFVWHILNLGAGNLWARWDGLGFAAVNDPNSIELPSGYAFSEINAKALTFAADAALTVAFTAENVA